MRLVKRKVRTANQETNLLPQRRPVFVAKTTTEPQRTQNQIILSKNRLTRFVVWVSHAEIPTSSISDKTTKTVFILSARSMRTYICSLQATPRHLQLTNSLPLLIFQSAGSVQSWLLSIPSCPRSFRCWEMWWRDSP